MCWWICVWVVWAYRHCAWVMSLFYPTMGVVCIYMNVMRARAAIRVEEVICIIVLGWKWYHILPSVIRYCSLESKTIPHTHFLIVFSVDSALFPLIQPKWYGHRIILSNCQIRKQIIKYLILAIICCFCLIWIKAISAEFFSC